MGMKLRIRDAQKVKLHLAGFAVVCRELSLGCIREWDPCKGWVPRSRHKSARSLNREYDRLQREPRVIVVQE